MAKFLLLWEVDAARVPVNPVERHTAWLGMLDLVKADMKKGPAKDWGTFPGEARGYSISEGTELEVLKTTLQYSPYVRFEVHPVASVDQVTQALKELMK